MIYRMVCLLMFGCSAVGAYAAPVVGERETKQIVATYLKGHPGLRKYLVKRYGEKKAGQIIDRGTKDCIPGNGQVSADRIERCFAQYLISYLPEAADRRRANPKAQNDSPEAR